MTTAAQEGAAPAVVEGEVPVVPAVAVVETPALDDSAGDADFDAGFEAEGQPTATPAGTADEAGGDKAEPAQPAEPAAAAPKYVQITEEDLARLNSGVASVTELKTALEKQIGTAFGKMGGLERTLSQLQSATPAGHAIEITDDIAAELVEEFPEIGAGTIKAFKKFAEKLKGVGPAAAPDAGQFETVVQARLVALQAEELADMHPDWREIVGTQGDQNNEYRQWLAKQPEDYQRKLNSTNSAGVIARSISKFTEAKAAPPPPTPKPTTRKDLIRDAVTPKGVGGTPPGPSEDDEFNSGFTSG